MPILHGFARQLGGRRSLMSRGWERTSWPWPRPRSSGSRPSQRIAAGRKLKLLSAAKNSFKCDYHGEDLEGQQVPILTVFQQGP